MKANVRKHSLVENTMSDTPTAGTELASRIATILVHLMKIEAATGDEPRAGLEDAIRTQRAEIASILQNAPSLRPTVGTLISTELGLARTRARGDLSHASYTMDQVLGDWFPG